MAGAIGVVAVQRRPHGRLAGIDVRAGTDGDVQLTVVTVE
jgi:hypothetical protein